MGMGKAKGVNIITIMVVVLIALVVGKFLFNIVFALLWKLGGILIVALIIYLVYTQLIKTKK